MPEKSTIVVTTVSTPTDPLIRLAHGAKNNGCQLLIIGDEQSPSDFSLQGGDFYSVNRQKDSGLNFAALCPLRSYARKNIGYLLAMRAAAEIITETDDDNVPYDSFWYPRRRFQKVRFVSNSGWLNVYRYFSHDRIWPRGLPLTRIQNAGPDYEALPMQEVDCPIQQGLVDGNPDVDAIYRLVLDLPRYFEKQRSVALGPGTWCPLNSQNTTWFRVAFPLLYLPAYCSFRMTDILRSFVAQRIAWENNWALFYHGPTLLQERNSHNLMRDFADEVPGYLNNERICEELAKLSIQAGTDRITQNLEQCYDRLVAIGAVQYNELELLNSWIEDLRNI